MSTHRVNACQSLDWATRMMGAPDVAAVHASVAQAEALLAVADELSGIRAMLEHVADRMPSS